MLLTHQIEKKKAVPYSQYEYALEVLPPAIWVKNGFLQGEPFDHIDIFLYNNKQVHLNFDSNKTPFSSLASA